MTAEITVLTLAGLLQSAQFLLIAIPANLKLGPAVTLAPRDDGPIADKLDPKTARLGRALNNHFEALILFAVAAVSVTLSDSGSGFTAACAWTYLVARILYIPAYYFGWIPWRSLIWAVGWFATVAMLLAALI